MVTAHGVSSPLLAPSCSLRYVVDSKTRAIVARGQLLALVGDAKGFIVLKLSALSLRFRILPGR